MIYVNGTLLDITQDTPYVKEYLSKREELLKNYEFPMVFTTRREPIINPSGVAEPPKIIIIPAASVVQEEFGTVEWRYTNSISRNGRYSPRSIMINGEIAVGKEDLDLAFFLLYKSQHGPKSGLLYLKDAKREADEYVSKKAALSGLTYILYDEDSPLSDEDVRTIALALGISNADDKKYTTNQVKLMIEQEVIKGETSGDTFCNYKTFKEFSRVNDWVKLLARIQKLYDKKVIEYDYVDGCFYLINQEGQRINRLYKISASDYAQKDRLLARKLMEDKVMLSLLNEHAGEKVDGDLDILTEEELSELSMDALRGLAKRKGIKSFGISKEELIKQLAGG
jgi:hypothetical protein